MTEPADFYSKLTYYRQRRADGGIRSGIALGADEVYTEYQEAPDEYDPTLLWSVDLRCDGSPLPREATEARDWLLAHEAAIREGFALFADHLGAGSDPTGAYLLQWGQFPNAPEGVRMKIACGVLRRFDALNLARTLRDVEAHWKEWILALRAVYPTIV